MSGEKHLNATRVKKQYTRFKPASNFILLIVPRRYFCGGSYCFMYWCLKVFVLFAPYVCFIF